MKFRLPRLNGTVGRMQDAAMNSLFAKILAGQVAVVVAALVLAALVTRAGLDRGFIDFLERQEAAVLTALAPALEDLYESQGGWDFLRQQPDAWHRVLRRARGAADADRPLRGRSAGHGPVASEPGGERRNDLRWLRSFDRLQLSDRLFLLDDRQRHLAGAAAEGVPEPRLQPVRVGGETVGWIGFRPLSASAALPPEAARFLRGQVRAMGIALLLAVALAAVLAYLLARYLSRPLQRLDETVLDLAEGRFERRAEVGGAAELARLARNVNDLAASLEHNRSARRRWIADIAHELRTPVAILKGEVEALADGVRAPNAESLGSLSQEIALLSQLVDDLQTLALADAGALDLRREPVDLGDLLAEVAETYRERLAARRIALDIESEGPAPTAVDPGKLRRLLQNLLENCARYTLPGGRVRVRAGAVRDRLEITVEDSGPGVSPTERERLFERFYRVEPARTRAAGGSGLGLAICRNIAEAHGGDIRAEASPLGGLAVVLTLPDGTAGR